MWELLLWFSKFLLWFLAFAAIVTLIGMSSYQLTALADLGSDYVNPYDSSSRINAIVPREFILQGILCAFFLLIRHWFPFLLMVHITVYHVKLFISRKHLIDVTKIFKLQDEEMKYGLIKLAVYFIIFIIVIYRLVMITVSNLWVKNNGDLNSGVC